MASARRAVFIESPLFDSPSHAGDHHYAELLARDGWRVLWISHPVSPLHLLARSTLGETRAKIAAWRVGVRTFPPGGVRAVAPFTLMPPKDVPLLRSRGVARRTFSWTLPSVARIASRLGFDCPDLLWFTNAYGVYLARRLAPARSVYRVTDLQAGFEGNPASMVALEEEAIGWAGLVVYTARTLEGRVLPLTSNALYLPNGCDYERFAGYDGPPPREYANVAGKKVVYVGAVSSWFDFDSLAAAAEALAEATFFIVGQQLVDIPSNARRPNVVFVGGRPYVDVPAFLTHADAGIVPFVRSAMVDSISPIKVYEYLAAGIPVVSTRWTELEGLDLPVRLCDSPHEFARALGQALAEGVAGAEPRRAAAREHTWDSNLAKVLEALK